MLRYMRFLFIGTTGVLLLLVALANRAPVPVRLLPQDLAAFLGLSEPWQMPLFLVIFAAVALGVLIGFVWEWFREMRIRGAAKVKTREVARLERELAVMRDTKGPEKDEVLALLDNGRS